MVTGSANSSCCVQPSPIPPAPIPGWVVGGVVWTITRGDGAFAGARGVITSNFTVSTDGVVVDNHLTRLYLP